MSRVAALFAVAGLMTVVFTPATSRAAQPDTATFQDFAGRWVGQGRLGLKDSPAETVKCRATYFLVEDGASLKQTIRCATSGGKIEVKSELKNSGGTLAGRWQETTRNISGALTGSMTQHGLKITVRSTEISANMDIVLRNDRQIVEIQFLDSAMIGLTLLLTKG